MQALNANMAGLAAQRPPALAVVASPPLSSVLDDDGGGGGRHLARAGAGEAAAPAAAAVVVVAAAPHYDVASSPVHRVAPQQLGYVPVLQGAPSAPAPAGGGASGAAAPAAPGTGGAGGGGGVSLSRPLLNGQLAPGDAAVATPLRSEPVVAVPLVAGGGGPRSRIVSPIDGARPPHAALVLPSARLGMMPSSIAGGGGGGGGGAGGAEHGAGSVGQALSRARAQIDGADAAAAPLDSARSGPSLPRPGGEGGPPVMRAQPAVARQAFYEEWSKNRKKRSSVRRGGGAPERLLHDGEVDAGGHERRGRRLRRRRTDSTDSGHGD